MSADDIRWIQRLNHYEKALNQLQDAVELAGQRSLTTLEEQGLIQAFEFTFELAWNTLKDYFESQGETGVHGSRDAFRLAFRRGLLNDGELWMEMIRSRTLTVHTYNEETARQIATAVIDQYAPAFVSLHTLLQERKDSPS